MEPLRAKLEKLANDLANGERSSLSQFRSPVPHSGRIETKLGGNSGPSESRSTLSTPEVVMTGWPLGISSTWCGGQPVNLTRHLGTRRSRSVQKNAESGPIVPVGKRSRRVDGDVW